MPNYPNAAGTTTVPTFPPFALSPGDIGVAFNAEQPATGQASQRFAVMTVHENAAPNLSVTVQFASAPGAFEFDVQEAFEDFDIAYETVTGGVINTQNNNYFVADFAPFLGRFVRILCKTQNANGVNATVKIHRK